MMKKDVTITLQSSKVFDQKYSYFQTDKNGEDPEFFLNYETNSTQDNFEIFLHEYCHFLQWKNKRKIYKDSFNSVNRYNDWLSYKRSRLSILDIRNIQKLEIDCDKLAVKTIIEKDLPIDFQKYILTSNSYVLSYNHSYEHRVFFSEKLPLDSEILDTLPKKFLTQKQLETGIKEHSKLFRKYYDYAFNI